jgi:hypothetical protein
MAGLQIVVVVLGVLLGLGFLVSRFGRARRRSPLRASDPPGVRTYVSLVGAERYMGPDEILEETVTCGRGLLEKVAEKLKQGGVDTGQIVTEDWGALLEVAAAQDRLHVCAGFRGEDWLLFVCAPRGPDVPVEDSAFLRTLLEGIDTALKSLPGIERVCWHRAEDWSAGQEDQGAATPLQA